MSRAGGRSGGGKRAITPDEAELWDHATRTLAPIKAKARVPEIEMEPASTPPRPPPPAKKASSPPAPRPPPSAPMRPEARRSPVPPLADLERRKVRQIASGKVEIEARIDLHGMRQRDAHAQLRGFLLDAHARGLKTVLVITGKGGEQDRSDHMASMTGDTRESRRGIIRRSVPQWLQEADLRAVVVGYTAASARHGGEGALYVQLRKPLRS